MCVCQAYCMHMCVTVLRICPQAHTHTHTHMHPRTRHQLSSAIPTTFLPVLFFLPPGGTVLLAALFHEAMDPCGGAVLLAALFHKAMDPCGGDGCSACMQ